MKSASITVRLDPALKRAIETRAKGLNIGKGDYVRRAVDAYDPDEHDDELAALARELVTTAERTEASLQAAVGSIEEFERFWAKRGELRRQTRAMLRDEGH